MVFSTFFNGIAALVEAVVGLFVSGFSIGRIERRKEGRRTSLEATSGLIMLSIVVGLAVWLWLGPKVMCRNVTLVAEDGHSLPFAAMVVQTKGGARHERTDNAGNLTIPRFGTRSLTIKDPRYVERTWQLEEIEPQLTVQRTVLGSGLDRLADKLLKPVKDKTGTGQ